MTDQVQPTFGAEQVEGQPSVESVQPDAPAQTPANYVTKDDLRTLQDALERRIQSLTDRQESRLKKQVDEKLGAIQKRYDAIGAKVPDSVRQRVIDEAVLAHEEDVQPEPAQAQPDDLRQKVFNRANQLVQKHGVSLEPSDPEYREIKSTSPDPFEFLDSVEAAAIKKAGRLQNEAQQRAGPMGSRAPMAVTGVSSGSDLRSEYERAKQGVRPGSEEMLQLRLKFRNKGLTDI